jgi:hypothetical protein
MGALRAAMERDVRRPSDDELRSWLEAVGWFAGWDFATRGRAPDETPRASNGRVPDEVLEA